MHEPAQSEAETAWRAAFAAVQQRESAYMFEHMTKPQTVAAVLSASPVALAAWVTEKFQSWGDTGGDIESRFSKDQLIANLMFYLAADRPAPHLMYAAARRSARAAVRPHQGLGSHGCRLVSKGVSAPSATRGASAGRHPALDRDEIGGHFAALEDRGLADDVRTFCATTSDLHSHRTLPGVNPMKVRYRTSTSRRSAPTGRRHRVAHAPTAAPDPDLRRALPLKVMRSPSR